MAGEEYTITLTASQRQRLAAATDVEKLRKAYVEISHELAESQFGAMGLDNVWDASGTKVRADALPEDQEVAIRFPGVDPRGRYSALDMRAAERLARIDSTLKLRGEAAQRAIQTVMQSPVYKRLEQELSRLASEQRILTRAEKLCPLLAKQDTFSPSQTDRAAASVVAPRNLHQRMRDIDSAETVVNMNLMLQGMEAMLGIRIGPIPQEVRTFFGEHRLDLSPATIEECRKPTLPESMTVEFPSFANKQAQLQFAKSENWGKQPKDYTPLSPSEIGSLIDPYLRATSGRALDAMFSSVEAATYMLDLAGERVVGSAMDRADYLCIGGKTVSQILAQRYHDGKYPGYDSYAEFMRQSGHQSVAELVSAALTAGKAVEAFIPDARGDIPDEPVRMTQHGFEPARFDPVTMNLWERFWSMFGFYREKTAQAEVQEVAQKARAEAHERVRLLHSANRTMVESGVMMVAKDDYFREWKEEAHTEKLPTESVKKEGMQELADFSLTRSAWTTFAKLEMLRRGYSLSDIVDPNKLQAEKQAVGKFVIDKIAAKEPPTEQHRQEGFDYLCELFRVSGQKYVEQIDAMARDYDLSNPKTYTSPEFFPMLKGLNFGYDAFQELGRVEEAFTAKYGADAFTRARNQLGTYGILERGVSEYYTMGSELLTGKPTGISTAGVMQGYVSGAARIRRAAEAFAANPGKAFSEVFTEKLGEDLLLLHVKSLSGAQIKSIQEIYDRSRDFHAQFDQAILADDMPSRIRLPKSDDPMGEIGLDESICAPARQAVEKQQKQQQKQAKKPQAPTR